MNHSWIKPGAKCRWNDPAIEDYPAKERKDALLREFTIVSVNGKDTPAEDDDDIVLISDGHTEAEVSPCEIVDCCDAKKEMKHSDFLLSQIRSLSEILKTTSNEAISLMEAALEKRNIRRIRFIELDIEDRPELIDGCTLDGIEFLPCGIDANFSDDSTNTWYPLDVLDKSDLLNILTLVFSVICEYDEGKYTVNANGDCILV